MDSLDSVKRVFSSYAQWVVDMKDTHSERDALEKMNETLKRMHKWLKISIPVRH